MTPQPHRVTAVNLAKNSENRMHDDKVAKRFGFKGGLVPGVDVLAYMSHMPVAKWGRAFLERGLMEGRFLKPVYDGEIAIVTAEDSGDDIAIKVESRGELCATGTASMPSSQEKISLGDFLSVPPVATRAPVDANSYIEGNWLGIPPYTMGRASLPDYLRDIGEDSIFAPTDDVIGAIYPKLDPEICRGCRARIFKPCNVVLPNGEPRTN